MWITAHLIWVSIESLKFNIFNVWALLYFEKAIFIKGDQVTMTSRECQPLFHAIARRTKVYYVCDC